MARENAIHVEGVVIEMMSNRTYSVELSNGHRVLAFLTRQDCSNFAQIAPGEKVMLQMSPYDLSEGRIILQQKN